MKKVVMNNINIEFSRLILSSVRVALLQHFPANKIIKDAWVYRFGKGHWEFHGPESFYWHGQADNAYDARAKGWMAWLHQKGVDVETTSRNDQFSVEVNAG